MGAPGLLFSDVDGTIVHYDDALAAHGALSRSEADGPHDTYTPAVRGGGGKRCRAACSRARPRRTVALRSACLRFRPAAPA